MAQAQRPAPRYFYPISPEYQIEGGKVAKVFKLLFPSESSTYSEMLQF
jgi:hypothetical protein